MINIKFSISYKSKVVVFCLLFFASYSLYTQDLHFSQFYASPMTTNPAMTGSFDGLVRISSNYRAQWDNIIGADYLYQTPSASVDINLGGSNLGLGLVFVNDQTNSKTFNTLESGLSVSYRIRTQRMHIQLGLQGWYSQRYLDVHKLDVQFISSDRSSFQTIRSLDFNAGIFATYFYPQSSNKLFYGISLFHLLQPDDNHTIKNTNFSLPFKPVFYLGAEYKIQEKWLWMPNLMFAMQAGTNQTNLGMNIGYIASYNEDYDPHLTYFIGMNTRLNSTTPQAMIPRAGIEYERIRIGFSYDFVINKLASAQRPNSIEIVLSYIIKPAYRSNENNCYFAPF